jgi:hypothetical protein
LSEKIKGEKYGVRFLAAIKSYCEKHPEILKNRLRKPSEINDDNEAGDDPSDLDYVPEINLAENSDKNDNNDTFELTTSKYFTNNNNSHTKNRKTESEDQFQKTNIIETATTCQYEELESDFVDTRPSNMKTSDRLVIFRFFFSIECRECVF